MAVLFLIAFPAILFEDDDLVTLQMIYDLSLNFFTVLSYGDATVVAYHKDVGKFNLVTGIALQAMHEQFIILFHFELLPCYCYYCKHDVPKIFSQR